MLRGIPRVEHVPTSDAQLSIMRSTVCDGAADRPGIYRMLSADGEVLYVGKSKRVRSRLLSYFRCAYPGDKGARILRSAESIEWEYTPSEFAALLQELRLIKRFRPRYNVAMKRDARHYSFIKLTRGPAPKLVVVRGASGDDAAIYYGPFVGAQRVDEALRELVAGVAGGSSDPPAPAAKHAEVPVAPATGEPYAHQSRGRRRDASHTRRARGNRGLMAGLGHRAGGRDRGGIGTYGQCCEQAHRHSGNRHSSQDPHGLPPRILRL